MKRFLFTTAVLFLSISSTANDACDMFDAELSIVQDQMRSIVEDVENCKKLAETAGEEKNQATDDKIMRLLKTAHKQSEIMSHSISQISLRKECACEGFDFNLVDQKIIEVKYWIKRAKSIDLEKQKSEQYLALTTNVNKLNEILTAFASYINDPCKSAKPPMPELEEKETKETPKDTLIAQAEAVPTVAQDTAPAVVTKPAEEIAPVVLKDTVIAPIVTVLDTGKAKEPIPEARVETIASVVMGSAQNITEPIKDSVIVKEPVPKQMDTVFAPVVSVTDTVKGAQPASEPEIIAIVDSIAVDTLTVEDSLSAMDTIRTVEIVVAGAVTPVMDTVKTTDFSIPEPEEIAEEKAPTPEAIVKVEMEPVVTAPAVKPMIVPVASPASVAKPIPTPNKEEVTGFYYAVQVAAGADKTMPSSVSKLTEEVYIYEEGGMNKFRVGHFLTLNEAVNSKNAIFKKGITDAFIVAYSNGNKIGIGEAKKIEAGSPPSASTATTAESNSIKKKDAPKPIPSKIKNKAEVFLAVQVGASVTAADPIYELAKYEHQLQMQIKVIQGKPVRYYTGETNNKNEAEQTLSLVKSKGVDGAFLIGISNGERIDYKAALEHLKL